MELSQETKNLISKFNLWQDSLKLQEGVSTIHVDEVASKVAAFYEQIRTIIDWKEEHLMRRAAIIRKLKRRFLDLEINNVSIENMAEPLVLECIRGGYFPNDKIEESKITDVQKILSKYIVILKNSPENISGKAGLNFYNRLLEIAACEIEETLAPSIKEMALIDYMFLQMQERIKVNENVYTRGVLKKEEKDIQIYIAVQQALFKLDVPIISYNLIKYKHPEWDNPSDQELSHISQNMYKMLNGIEYNIAHPLGKKFYAICEKYDTPYLLLGDILSKGNIEKIATEIQEPALLEEYTRNVYLKRLADLKTKIARAAIYSTASIFITKILSLVVLEIILAKIFSGYLNTLLLFADVAIPTLLMSFLVITIKPPSKKNLSLVVMETIKIVYKKEKKDTYEIKIARKRSLMTRLILSLIYLIGAGISFGFIIWVFVYFAFPVTSIIINLIFIALILFTGMAVRTRSQELTIEEEKGGFFGFISDILVLPIAGAGRWLSNTWKQYNAITAFFNALIDMPFSSFIEFLERWRYFIKEKKEELR
ncbi:MAG: hypothetical protein A3A98_03370 [Candidatus Staskawiczbacteria bacterium RIFCSPLOWO2_01_FULL_40_39]|uniref:Uncharacterized protein n=1 Tax=Candidatus Staskawiczbacteria bacterium RIFCSPHIGHO2_01_FULL_39_25 TaxID=1802202 RepID=A0A1G2HQ90_9BACT|nr:MAG: hypothetical protein A2730_02645 [Candidatus Staskawiczbacteria bacterium RIFCSPHIGHO2_01_FULL_39_25]OGZ72854.1 MAG: hypothetical protein A3A98_03370 [Candidatus Staskawiczbacteria bacterium RIFCSPLOWO2_01_FULL_40_39]OGZ75221.1 MAG: hypothetical protein A3I87_00920 [Candidatus Staskawiczbacteria bacterium RIFCSPLOWO2_02_FULL_39_8]